ncbi:MAG: arsenate reductase (azurin) small subunit [Myxococcota bacterium]
MREENPPGRLCMKRREFLLASGATAATVLITLPGCASPMWARKVSYPRKRIASLSELRPDVPSSFRYPDDDPAFSGCLLVKLGVPAGAGVGPEQDVVAFSTLCNHMGGPLAGTYKPQHKGLGPCPLHLTTFDLVRHGIVVAGHSTESLPQILLEVEGDDVFASGVMGLLYGRATNVS